MIVGVISYVIVRLGEEINGHGHRFNINSLCHLAR